MALRTLNAAIRELREEDPNSIITYGLLRRWIASGKVKYEMNGNRFVVDTEELRARLKGE